jgi:hypothetical protein
LVGARPTAVFVGERPTAATETVALVRLKAHGDDRVKVPDLADTEGPIIESNCAGAILPGGESL